jgi:hypothetical protein
MMNKRTFEEWMAEVTREMMKKCGMGPDDLPDWGYRSAYDRGVQPARAASSAIAAAKRGY